MLTKDVVVKCSTGLHARPATLLVKKASAFKSDINIEYEGKRANVKSLIGVLSLGVKRNATIKLIVAGNDEKLAIDELTKVIENMDF